MSIHLTDLWVAIKSSWQICLLKIAIFCKNFFHFSPFFEYILTQFYDFREERTDLRLKLIYKTLKIAKKTLKIHQFVNIKHGI